MEIIIGFFIFCLVLFIYLHIQFHLKTGEDLEMYEVDEPSKEKLEEICDIRQPVLFEFDNNKIIENTNKTYIAANYYAFETKIRNVKDGSDSNSNSELYMPLPLHATVKLFNEDKTSSYFSENNSEFLEETGYQCENLKYLLLHCKNLDALYELMRRPFKYVYFWHQEDDFTLTSNDVIWTYPGKHLTNKSVAVVPERCESYWKHVKTLDLVGVCTDYVEKFISETSTLPVGSSQKQI